MVIVKGSFGRGELGESNCNQLGHFFVIVQERRTLDAEHLFCDMCVFIRNSTSAVACRATVTEYTENVGVSWCIFSALTVFARSIVDLHSPPARRRRRRGVVLVRGGRDGRRRVVVSSSSSSDVSARSLAARTHTSVHHVACVYTLDATRCCVAKLSCSMRSSIDLHAGRSAPPPPFSDQ